MRIEDIIKEQRENLDLESPPEEIWEGIRTGWKSDSKTNSYKWWKVAAIVFISTSVALLLYSLSLQNQVSQLASLGDISAEYKAIEDKYEREIISLETSLDLQQVSEHDDFAWIVEEMKTLEEINELYRRDIGQNADQHQLVNALIDYYEKKIKLLKKLELEINRTQKFNENEKNNTDTVII